MGGINCDGGELKPGEWTHIAATYDGATARLYQDGKLVAETTGMVNGLPWEKPMHVGQYSAGPNDSYQFKGYIADVKIYNRVLSDEDTRTAVRKLPGKDKASV